MYWGTNLLRKLKQLLFNVNEVWDIPRSHFPRTSQASFLSMSIWIEQYNSPLNEALRPAIRGVDKGDIGTTSVGTGIAVPTRTAAGHTI